MTKQLPPRAVGATAAFAAAQPQLQPKALAVTDWAGRMTREPGWGWAGWPARQVMTRRETWWLKLLLS